MHSYSGSKRDREKSNTNTRRKEIYSRKWNLGQFEHFGKQLLAQIDFVSKVVEVQNRFKPFNDE